MADTYRANFSQIHFTESTEDRGPTATVYLCRTTLVDGKPVQVTKELEYQLPGTDIAFSEFHDWLRDVLVSLAEEI